uniref:Uncharacterized protein n=1 Tax=Kalanchoe fedtschenkoi TaxID=63787 RepID=A0A7N0TYM5_KALFE
MADDSLVDDGAAEDQTAESFYDFETSTSKVSDLVKKVEALERERSELVKENNEVKERVKKWEEEVLGLKSEKERMQEVVKKTEEERKALAAIASRAADLETEVSRLQHDLVSAISDGDESNAELREVRKALEEKKASLNKLEKEKEATEESFVNEVAGAKKAKTLVEA